MSDAERDRLLSAARDAAERAYCRYSQFRVGAAVLTEDGSIFTGCNVENASFGLGMCAERVAVFSAVAAGHRKLRRIAVSCPDANPQSSESFQMPCGACRQVIAEFGDLGLIVHIDRVGDATLRELLPRPFKFDEKLAELSDASPKTT